MARYEAAGSPLSRGRADERFSRQGRVGFRSSATSVIALRPDQPPRQKITQRGGACAEECERQRSACDFPDRRAGRTTQVQRKHFDQRGEHANTGAIGRRPGETPRPRTARRRVKRWKHPYPAAAACVDAGTCASSPVRSGSTRRRISASSRATMSAVSSASRCSAVQRRNSASCAIPVPERKR